MEPEEINRIHWDEIAPIHYRSYGIPEFLAGRSPLYPEELKAVGEVKGKALLHLQCHIGTDTLGWAREGARVTGVDISPASIEHARELFREAGAEGTFLVSDVFALEADPLGEFDVVYTSRGVLCWLRDLDAWARIVAGHLKPGGIFYIMETHPALGMFFGPDAGTLSIDGRYFHRDEATIWDDGEPDYADPEYRSKTPSAEWDWALSDIFHALWGAGLTIESFEEHDRLFFKALRMMERLDDRWWVLPDHRGRIPLTFTLKARRAAP
jgi:SAM-dependent methyltransferase